MEKVIWQNAKSAKWVIGSFVGGFVVVQQCGYKPGLLISQVGYDLEHSASISIRAEHLKVKKTGSINCVLEKQGSSD